MRVEGEDFEIVRNFNVVSLSRGLADVTLLLLFSVAETTRMRLYKVGRISDISYFLFSTRKTMILTVTTPSGERSGSSQPFSQEVHSQGKECARIV